MAVAWKNRSSLKWVDELWASSFGAKRNDTQTWSLLGEAIALATFRQ
jgi:hypothetical protein